MPSTPSPRLRAELQSLGENLSTWGDTRLNEALKRLEEGIAQVFAKAVTGDYTLASSNYVADEARAAVLVLTGAPGATFKITIPGVQKTYFVANKTDAPQNIGASGGLAAQVPAGRHRLVFCDGTDTWHDNPSISQLPKPTGNIDMSMLYTLNNLPDAVLPQQPGTKAQVDAVRAFAAGIANSGVLAPGTTANFFLRWNGSGWVEGAIPPLVTGANTSVAGSFTAGDMRVDVVTGTGPDAVVGRDPAGRIPVAVSAWPVKTGAYTAANGDQLRVDTTAGAVTITTPASAAVDDQFMVLREGVNAVTVARNGGAGSIGGKAEDFIFDAAGQLATFICISANTWRVIPGQYA